MYVEDYFNCIEVLEDWTDNKIDRPTLKKGALLFLLENGIAAIRDCDWDPAQNFGCRGIYLDRLEKSGLKYQVIPRKISVREWQHWKENESNS